MFNWDRYATYGIVGTVFWLSALICRMVYGTDFPELAKVDHQLTALSRHLQAADDGGKLFASLLTVLGLAAVFSTGMLVDVLSPHLIRRFEIAYFRRYVIQEERTILTALFMSNQDADFAAELDAFGVSRSPPIYRLPSWLTEQHRYNKLSTYLIVHCVKTASGKVQDLFGDQLALWKTTRAMSGALILPALSLDLLLLVSGTAKPESMILKLGFVVILWAAGSALAIGQFARLCNTMRAIVHMSRAESEQPQHNQRLAA